MKSGLIWILALSLCANGVLLAARWRSAVTSDGSTRTSVQSNEELTGSMKTTVVGRSSDFQSASPGTAVVSSGPSASQPTLWARLDLSDLKSVVATLRSAGTPEGDLRTIVEALVRERFKARIEAAQVGGTNQPFWKTRSGTSAASQRFSESYAIWREVEAITVDLLGAEPLDPVNAFSLRQRFGPLSDDKLEAIIRLDRDYGDLSMQARSGSPGPRMPWEQESLAFVEAEKRRDMEALLSPAELETYDFYTSSTASSLHRQLEGFGPTEAEFRAIFAMQREFDAKVGASQPGASLAAVRAVDAARPQLLEQVKAYLGEERYADYVRSTDSGFQAALAVTRRLNLPPDNAAAAYELNQELQARARDLRSSSDLSEADRSAALAVLLDEANTRLTGLLTSGGAEAFKARSGVFRALESTRRQP